MQEIYAEFNNNYKKIFNFVSKWVWNPDDAEDVIQESMVLVAKRNPETVNNKLGWYYTTLSSLCYAHNKKRIRHNATYTDLTDEYLDETSCPERIFSAKEGLSSIIYSIKTTSNPIHRDILTCCLVDGYSMKEVAEGYGIDYNTVVVCVKRFRDNYA